MAMDYIMWLLENREKALAARAEEIERERAQIRETADKLKEVSKEGEE